MGGGEKQGHILTKNRLFMSAVHFSKDNGNLCLQFGLLFYLCRGSCIKGT